jgi:hypothetical protein
MKKEARYVVLGLEVGFYILEVLPGKKKSCLPWRAQSRKGSGYVAESPDSWAV